MTKFEKSNFDYHGGYLTYQGKFVARFKHVPSNRADFVSFLIKNFSVEEYFAARDRGNAPGTILANKGHIPKHIRKWLADGTLKEWSGVEMAQREFKH